MGDCVHGLLVPHKGLEHMVGFLQGWRGSHQPRTCGCGVAVRNTPSSWRLASLPTPMPRPSCAMAASSYAGALQLEKDPVSDFAEDYQAVVEDWALCLGPDMKAPHRLQQYYVIIHKYDEVWEGPRR